MRPAAVVSVTAAVALGSAALAGGPLYVSSAATRDVQVQLAATCGTDAGLRLPVYGVGPLTQAVRAQIDGLSDVEGPTATSILSAAAHTVGGPEVSVALVARSGQELERGIEPLGVNEVAVPASTMERFDAAVGETLSIVPRFSGAATVPVEMTIVASYRDVEIRPEPPLWCGLRDLFRPGPFGDAPPPVLLVAASTFETNPGLHTQDFVEWHPAPRMTRRDAADLADAFAASVDTYRDAVRADLPDMTDGLTDVQLGVTDTSQLGDLVGRAEVVAEVVGRTVTPVVLTGLAGAVVVLALAGLLVARRATSELRLRLLRGTSPIALAARVTLWVLPAACVGTLTGIVLAVVAVRTRGPSAQFETDAVRRAVALGIGGGVLGTLLITVAAATTAATLVDASSPSRHRRWVPWELLVVVVALASYVRLNQVGGVQLIGASARGGDVLVQAFPLLALGAVLAILVRPLRLLLGRLRRHGRRWPLAPLIAMRRWSSDPTVTVATVLATGFITGLAVFATSSAASASQSLRDKSRTFNGSDLVIRAQGDLPLPVTIGDQATIVRRLTSRDDHGIVNIVGIDPATFGRGVHWLPAAAGRSVADVADTVADLQDVDSRLDGIAVGGTVEGDLQTAIGRRQFRIDITDEMPWFPAMTNGARLVVVDAGALARSGLPSRQEIWIREPPDDVTAQLTAAGWRPFVSLEASASFDAAGYRAMRYAYGAFSALAGLGLVVVMIGELLVIDARHRRRAASDVINRSIGLPARTRTVVTLLEFAAPLTAGALLGIGTGLGVLTAANPKLNPLRALPPTARTVIDTAGIISVLAGITAVAIILILVAALARRRADPMGAMRGK